MTERATQPHRGRLTALGPAVWLRRENHMVWRVGDRYLAGFNWELRFVWLVSGYLLGSLPAVCVLFSRYNHELRPSSVPFPIIYTCLHPPRSVHHCYYYYSYHHHRTPAPLLRSPLLLRSTRKPWLILCFLSGISTCMPRLPIMPLPLPRRQMHRHS